METRSRKGNNTNLDSSSNILTKTVPVQTEMPRAHVMQSTDRESERYLEQLLRVYEDQVLMLRCELGKKNEMISDLMKIINSFNEDRFATRRICLRGKTLGAWSKRTVIASYTELP